MIEIADFDILTMVKLGWFFIFFSRDYLGLMTRVMSHSTLDFILNGLFPSHDTSCGLTS